MSGCPLGVVSFGRRAKWGAQLLRAPLKPACGTIVTAIVTVQAARSESWDKRSKNREFASQAAIYPQARLRFSRQLLLHCNNFTGESGTIRRFSKGTAEAAATQAASPAASFALSA
jgi:G:T/U-mismatch repair DNA glycosylase